MLGIAAGALFVIGLLRVFYFEKGASYYFHSHAFLTKFSLFVIIGVLSVVPTLEFLSWRDTLKIGEVPAVDAARLRRVSAVIHAELAAIIIILLCAAIMAVLNEKEGFRRCGTTFNCTDACPRGIQVTKAILEVKRSLIFRR